MAPLPTSKPVGTLVGFLICCFLVVGLSGLFAVFALPIPLERAASRDAVLDDVLLAADQPNALAALRPKLDTAADAVLTGPGTLTERVAKARVAMHAQMALEEGEFSRRMIWLIGMITLCAGGFGAMLLVLAARRT
jgi:hypothetical protein